MKEKVKSQELKEKFFVENCAHINDSALVTHILKSAGDGVFIHVGEGAYREYVPMMIEAVDGWCGKHRLSFEDLSKKQEERKIDLTGLDEEVVEVILWGARKKQKYILKGYTIKCVYDKYTPLFTCKGNGKKEFFISPVAAVKWLRAII